MPAIVTSGGSAASLTVTQSLGRMGVPVHVISKMKHAACFYSRYAASRHLIDPAPSKGLVGINPEEPEELLDYLVEKVEKGVLFPSGDSNVRFLAKHKRALLEAGFRLCIPDEEVLVKALNKSDLAGFCKERGYPVPETVVVDGEGDLERVAALRFPVVLKGVYMKNHAFVERREDLAEVYRRFRAEYGGTEIDPQAVAQEWVPGPDDRFVKVYVMCDLEGRVVAAHNFRRLRVHTRADGSQGDTLAGVTERVPAAMEQWLPFFKELGWVGMASLECKYDERDGKYKVIEINPRPWATLKISVDCGVDIPALYYRIASGEAVEPSEEFEEGRYYIRIFWGLLERPEPVRVAGMLKRGLIKPGEVLALYGKLLWNWRRTTVDVGRLSDPMPTLRCMWHYGHPKAMGEG